jgi:hypothetical protein
VAEWRQRQRRRLLVHFGVRVEHVEDPLGRGDRLLQVGVDATEFLGWSVHQEGGGKKRRELPGRQPTGGNLLCAVPEGRSHPEAANQLHERRQAG